MAAASSFRRWRTAAARARLRASLPHAASNNQALPRAPLLPPHSYPFKDTKVQGVFDSPGQVLGRDVSEGILVKGGLAWRRLSEVRAIGSAKL